MITPSIPSFHTVGDDCLMEIFSYLSYEESQIVSCVNKRIRAIFINHPEFRDVQPSVARIALQLHQITLQHLSSFPANVTSPLNGLDHYPFPKLSITHMLSHPSCQIQLLSNELAMRDTSVTQPSRIQPDRICDVTLTATYDPPLLLKYSNKMLACFLEVYEYCLPQPIISHRALPRTLFLTKLPIAIVCASITLPFLISGFLISTALNDRLYTAANTLTNWKFTLKSIRQEINSQAITRIEQTILEIALRVTYKLTLRRI